MSTKIDKVIALHNEALEDSVKETIYLEQVIKSRFRQEATKPSFLDSLNLRLAKAALTYVFLFFILVVANFFIIQSLEDRKQAPKIGATVGELDIFMAAVPGSVTSAYTEVSPWEK